MTLLSSILIVLAAIGIFSIAIAITWIVPHLWHRIRGSFKPSIEDLNRVHMKEKSDLEIQYLQRALDTERSRANALNAQLEETLEKLVSRIN